MFHCALIGCGYWGSKLKRYIEENEHFQLRYYCNSKSDLNEVWNDKQVNAVIVATPNETHYPLVRSALLHGKNVFSEKPLAMKTIQCEELNQIARDNNLRLTVEYTYTFSRSLKKALSIISKGEVGKILGIEMSVKHLGRFKGGSVYWLLASHMLSVLDMFIPLRELTFSKTDLVVFEEQIETGIILFKNDYVSGQIITSLNYPGKESRIIIYGEKGTIIYNPVSHPSLHVEKYERLKWTVASELPRESIDFSIDETNNLRYAMEHFLDVLEGREEGNIERAIAITQILETLENV